MLLLNFVFTISLFFITFFGFSSSLNAQFSELKFLYYNGINERFISLTKNLQSDKKLKALESNFRRLTDPEGLGGLIKCIYISKKELDLSYFK